MQNKREALVKRVKSVICIKWGDAYDAQYVNKLYSMVKRNSSFKINFYCFTDNSDGLDEDIVVKNLPILNTKKEYQTIHAYRKEAALCDDNLGDLKGQRVFFFDLDVVVISDLDEFFEYPKGDKFYIIDDWNSKGSKIGQASCYSWRVGALGYIKEYFEKNPKEVVDRFFTASQEYLSSKVIEKYGKLNFWPQSWFCSFGFHCMPRLGLLRHFIAPSIPKEREGLKVIVFHGMPNPKEAIEGIWKIKKRQILKRLYKVCKKTKWIEEYWR